MSADLKALFEINAEAMRLGAKAERERIVAALEGEVTNAPYAYEEFSTAIAAFRRAISIVRGDAP